ncbi:MAG: hypothetical protein UZ17_ACD001002900 [Acidobacteria bacterium OLB17]|nr:MAG: hypothetical protein UZ17_ACD001002900 [Acidobacteria bacterium OLB17]
MTAGRIAKVLALDTNVVAHDNHVATSIAA